MEYVFRAHWAEGLMVHSTLGVVGWVPNRNQMGEHQVLVKATDAAGNVKLVPFDLTVVAPNTAPVFILRQPMVRPLLAYRMSSRERSGCRIGYCHAALFAP